MIKCYTKRIYDYFNNTKFKLLDFGYVVGGSEWHECRYPTKVTRLYYIIGGDGYVINDGKRIDLEAGSCYLIPTGTNLEWACDSYLEKVYFHIKITDIVGRDTLGDCGRIMQYTPDAAVFERLKHCVHSSSFNDSISLCAELLLSLVTMFDKYGFELTVKDYSPSVKQAIDYITSHVSINLSIEKVAANAYVSVSTLSKKFKSEMGMTVGEYIESVVMREADELLRNSSLSVSQISERLEFCYPSYFSKRYKRWHGFSPRKFRKKSLEDYLPSEDEIIPREKKHQDSRKLMRQN